MIYEFDGMIPKIDPTTFVSESATIISNVEIGKNCYIGPGAVVRGDVPGSKIWIGDYSVVEDCVVIHGNVSGDVHIGARVTIGHSAVVHCKKLGDYANVGIGAILSLESEIGDYSVVAEGSVVKSRQIVSDRVVVGGIPAKELRALSDADIEAWKTSNEWYEGLTKKCLDPKLFRRID